MSTARTEILARLKAASPSSVRPSTPALIPKRGQAEGQARTDMFVEEAVYGLAEVVRLQRWSEVVDKVTQVMADAGTDKLKAAPHPKLQDLDWSGVEIAYGRGQDDDLVGLSVAYGAVAETGTLVMRSGADAPATLNFLPDVHVVVLQVSDIAANYEAVWACLLKEHNQLPRTVNWITGPSRTADIEQTMLLGAHGPRKLVIVLIDEKA